MLPTIPSDHTQPTPADDRPRYFVDDSINDGLDADWWLGLGSVDLPNVPGV